MANLAETLALESILGPSRPSQGTSALSVLADVFQERKQKEEEFLLKQREEERKMERLQAENARQMALFQELSSSPGFSDGDEAVRVVDNENGEILRRKATPIPRERSFRELNIKDGKVSTEFGIKTLSESERKNMFDLQQSQIETDRENQLADFTDKFVEGSITQEEFIRGAQEVRMDNNQFEDALNRRRMLDSIKENPQAQFIDQVPSAKVSQQDSSTPFSGDSFVTTGIKVDPTTGLVKDETKTNLTDRIRALREKGMSGESSVRYAGSKQGLELIGDIKKLLGVRRDANGNVVSDQSKIQTFLEIMGSKAAGWQEPMIFGSFPGTFGIGTLISQASAGTEARKIDLAFQTLAENVLRARTGAQAPDTEKVAEEKRSFVRLFEAGRPDIILERLETNEEFLGGMLNSIDPQGIFSSDSEVFKPKSRNIAVERIGVSNQAVDQALDNQVNQFLDSIGAN